MKKAQLKIQETAFVLLAVALLFGLVFIFYSKFQISKIVEEAERIKQEKAISMLSRIAAMPELRCSASFSKSTEALCIDEDKLNAFLEIKEEYKKFFRGLASINITIIAPEEKSFELLKGKGNSTYSAFTSICQEKYNGKSWFSCGFAVIYASA